MKIGLIDFVVIDVCQPLFTVIVLAIPSVLLLLLCVVTLFPAFAVTSGGTFCHCGHLHGFTRHCYHFNSNHHLKQLLVQLD